MHTAPTCSANSGCSRMRGCKGASGRFSKSACPQILEHSPHPEGLLFMRQIPDRLLDSRRIPLFHGIETQQALRIGIGGRIQRKTIGLDAERDRSVERIDGGERTPRQERAAACAARMASSSWSREQSGASANTRPVAGLITPNVPGPVTAPPPIVIDGLAVARSLMTSPPLLGRPFPRRSTRRPRSPARTGTSR